MAVSITPNAMIANWPIRTGHASAAICGRPATRSVGPAAQRLRTRPFGLRNRPLDAHVQPEAFVAVGYGRPSHTSFHSNAEIAPVAVVLRSWRRRTSQSSSKARMHAAEIGERGDLRSPRRTGVDALRGGGQLVAICCANAGVALAIIDPR